MINHNYVRYQLLISASEFLSEVSKIVSRKISETYIHANKSWSFEDITSSNNY